MRFPVRRLRILFSLLLTVSVLASAAPASQEAHAAAIPKSAVRLSGGEKCFKETGRCMHGVFLGYWQANGGLAQFGFPVTDELTEDGRTVQYTERARFEWHSDLRDTSSEVLLSLFGANSPQGAPTLPFNKVTAAASGTYFPQTGHTLAEPFLAYWQSKGGLPVSATPSRKRSTSESATDGKLYRVQYFQRNRLEYHPEAKGTPYEIQLGLLGKEFYKRIYGNAAVPAPVPYPVSIDALQAMQRAGSDLKLGSVTQ